MYHQECQAYAQSGNMNRICYRCWFHALNIAWPLSVQNVINLIAGVK